MASVKWERSKRVSDLTIAVEPGTFPFAGKGAVLRQVVPKSPLFECLRPFFLSALFAFFDFPCYNYKHIGRDGSWLEK